MKYFKIEELTHSATAQARFIENVPSAEAVRNLETLIEQVLDPHPRAVAIAHLHHQRLPLPRAEPKGGWRGE